MAVNTGWSSDTQDRVQNWLDIHDEFTMPMFLDDQERAQQLATIYGLSGVPMMVLVDEDHQLLYRGLPGDFDPELLIELLGY